MLSLSTCWNSHRHENGEFIAHEAEQLGFSHVELSRELNADQVQALKGFATNGAVRISSVMNDLHCPGNVEFTSDDASVRKEAIALTKRSIELAASCNARFVVLTLGRVPMKAYTDELLALTHAGKIYSREYIRVKLELIEQRAKTAQRYLDRARTALDEFLPFCESHQVALGLETRSHYEKLPTEQEMLGLMDHFRDCPWIGVWHDFGHMQRKANLGLLDHEEALRNIAPRLMGCHLHDVAWPASDHLLPLSSRGVDYARLLPLVPKDSVLVWQVKSTIKRAQFFDHMKEWSTLFPVK
ncbi:hypothetical protein BH11VER1_BH11VER1_37280 [soil metagenome]